CEVGSLRGSGFRATAKERPRPIQVRHLPSNRMASPHRAKSRIRKFGVLSTEYGVLNNRLLIANTAYAVLHPLVDREITAAIALVARYRQVHPLKGRWISIA